MSRSHALISGGGIAGPALAHQLAARGWHTTVIERFPEHCDEGHNIDVREAAREVVRRMGIDDDIRAANTTEVGMRFLDGDGSVAASFPMDNSGRGEGPTADARLVASAAVRRGLSLAGKAFGSIAAENIKLPDYSSTDHGPIPST
jgi:2-polyprenyl-6-methoxyphenol hydroxylase-like FAD-dependent oxidoreductase